MIQWHNKLMAAMAVGAAAVSPSNSGRLSAVIAFLQGNDKQGDLPRMAKIPLLLNLPSF